MDTAGGHVHPYLPKELHLPHYRPNQDSLPHLLGAFFGVIALYFVIIWAMTSRPAHLRANMADRLKVCWFAISALIHIVLEGYFSLYHDTLPGQQSYLAQLWKEYSKGDSRYVSADTFVVCVETVTAFWDGPLALLAVYGYMRASPSRLVTQLVLSLCQIYGDVLYLGIEAREGFVHGPKGDPLYFWCYFVFFNVLWLVVPAFLVAEAWVKLTRAARYHENSAGRRDNSTSPHSGKKWN